MATRVGYSLIFLLNSLLAWMMLTDWAIKLVAEWSFDWIKMECSGGKCYGVLAVRPRIPYQPPSAKADGPRSSICDNSH